MSNPIGIYRITDYRNLPFILDNGLHCANSPIQDENFYQIGFPTLIDKRRNHPVPIEPFGVLGDYVPFYFAPKSPMLFAIEKGNDPEVVGKVENIVYLVSTVESARQFDRKFVFTDRNAKLEYAIFDNKIDNLKELPWDVIRSDQWGRQYGVDRREMKQAEFLVKDSLPVGALIGIGCKTEAVQSIVNEYLAQRNIDIKTKIKSECTLMYD